MHTLAQVKEIGAGDIVVYFLASLSVKVWLFGFVLCFFVGLFWLWFPVQSWRDFKKLQDAWLFAFIMGFAGGSAIWIVYKVGACVFGTH